MSDLFSLQFVKSQSIRHPKLEEPSGLTRAADGTLWTVSDKARRLFQLNTDGELLASIKLEHRDLEGITFDHHDRLLVVDEDGDRIRVLDRQNGDQLDQRRISDMSGFAKIEPVWKASKHGLEGITGDPVRDEILLLKEAEPCLLIAVSADLQTIHSVVPLGPQLDPDRPDELDASGLCYDPMFDLLWIVSDRGRSLFGFDRRSDQIEHALPLTRKEDSQRIKKAEGVALDSEQRLLYVVCDQDATLTTYRLIHQQT